MYSPAHVQGGLQLKRLQDLSMPKKGKSKGKAKGTPAQSPVVINEVTLKAAPARKSAPPKGGSGVLRWSDTVLFPGRGCARVPDMRSLPSGLAQSFLNSGSARFASTNFGGVAAVQLAPAAGPTGTFRSTASIAGDVITWGAWTNMTNQSSIVSSAPQVRPSSASLEACSSGLPLTSESGTLYALVGTTTEIGQATTSITALLGQARIAATPNCGDGVAKAVFGFNCPNDFDYRPSASQSAGDGDTDILTVIMTFMAASQSLTAFAVVNWECNVANRFASILPVAPAVVDSADLQRGLKALARSQVFIQETLDIGLGQYGPLMIASNAYVPYQTTSSTLSQTSQDASSRSVSVEQYSPPPVQPTLTARVTEYTDAAEAASRGLRSVIENAAATATALGLGLASSQLVARQ